MGSYNTRVVFLCSVVVLQTIITCSADVRASNVRSLYASTFSGEGTYYNDAAGMVSCQIPRNDLPPAGQNSDMLGALNVQQYFGSAACGMCFRLTGSGQGLGNDPIVGDNIVYINDLCPACHAGDIDVAAQGDGRWDIQIRAVPCPVGNTKIQYKFAGSNPWYTKLQLRNTRVPAAKVEIYSSTSPIGSLAQAGDASSWVTLPPTADGHYSASVRTQDQGGIAVRLTSVYGHVVHDIIPRMSSNVMNGLVGVQFPQN